MFSHFVGVLLIYRMQDVQKERLKIKNFFSQEDLTMRTPRMLLVCMLTLLLGTQVAVCVPPNDDCVNATVVGNVTDLHFDTTHATVDGPEVCTLGHSANIWYRYTATCSGWITVSLCGSIYNTKLGVYDGGACPATAGRLIECNNNFCDGQSQVTFLATSGREYLIEVGGFATSKGQCFY